MCPEVGWEVLKCSKGKFQVKYVKIRIFTQPPDRELDRFSLSEEGLRAHLVSKHFKIYIVDGSFKDFEFEA